MIQLSPILFLFQGCEWHSYNVSLSLGSVLVHLDLNATLLQPFRFPENASGLSCALLPLQELRLLSSTRLEFSNWEKALLELSVTAQVRI